MSKRFFRLKQVMEETGKSRSSIYEDMASGIFPKCFTIGARAVAWYEDDVNNWKRERLQGAGKELA